MTETRDPVERIEAAGELLAIIIRSSFRKDGIEFFTPSTFSQQLGYMSHPEGHVITAHRHNRTPRRIDYTNEVLFLKSGRARVDLYDSKQTYVVSSLLATGDVILLVSGGHGFTMLEPTEMIEVKQGPYKGDEDKTPISAISKDEIRF
jgi:hypothetical protein